MSKKLWKLRMLPQALQDLQEIGDYIARDNPASAKKMIRHVRERCERLIDFPRMGCARPDIVLGIQHFPVGSYLILYCVTSSTIDVVRVVHSARTHYSL